jgi:hypothetical protein
VDSVRAELCNATDVEQKRAVDQEKTHEALRVAQEALSESEQRLKVSGAPGVVSVISILDPYAMTNLLDLLSSLCALGSYLPMMYPLDPIYQAKEVEMEDMQREIDRQIPKLAAASAEHAAQRVKAQLDQKYTEINKNMNAKAEQSIQAERARTTQYQHRCSELEQRAQSFAMEANTRIQHSQEQVQCMTQEDM